MSRASSSRPLAILAASLSLTLAVAGPGSTQVRYATGQNVVPVFEGWEKNADGTISMVFGYMNRNYEEAVDVPVGPNNILEPGLADQGQPTHFYTRRQQFVFKVKVPADWGRKDLVWTLNVRGKPEKAYASLLPFWQLGPFVYQENRGSAAEITDVPEPNEPPASRLAGPDRHTRSRQHCCHRATAREPPHAGGGPARSGRASRRQLGRVPRHRRQRQLRSPSSSRDGRQSHDARHLLQPGNLHAASLRGRQHLRHPNRRDRLGAGSMRQTPSH
jgi:hypothetical protein